MMSCNFFLTLTFDFISFLLHAGLFLDWVLPMVFCICALALIALPCDFRDTKKHDMVVSQQAGHGVLLGRVLPGVQPVVFLRVWAEVHLYTLSSGIFFQIQGRIPPEHCNES